MQRIAIIGSGGAGKSTLARQLGERLGLPVIHLDAHFWRPGWQPTPADEWTELQQALVAQDRWVMDGNYGSTLDLRLAAADSVIFLDLPPLLCLWRVLKRRIRYAGKSRPDMREGCPEQLDWQFVQWVWRYRRTRQPAVLAKLAALGPDKQVIRLRSPRQVAAFVAAHMV